jgi:hypothetical protein
MPRRYSIDGQDTNTAAETILGLTSASTIRPGVYDLICGSDATPADNAAEYVLQRYTVAGTSTAVTPRPLDPDDPASLAAGGEAHSAEPTYTADVIMLQWAQNQRATFRWVAAPNGEIILPATAANGVGIQTITVAGSAVNTNCCMHFVE